VIIEEAPRVPHHVEDAVATIAALHAAHHREARALQKAISRATSGIAQPGTLILITLAIAIWVTFNLALPEFGRTRSILFHSHYWLRSSRRSPFISRQ
jgi:dihydroorotase-like cyclic amidohydrolase